MEKLITSGLGSITFSIYSSRALIHNKMRKETGLFEKAINAVMYLVQKSAVTVNLQTILSRYNLLELDKLIEMAYELNVNNLYFSYIEGDIGNQWLPTVKQIQKFREVVLPKIINIVQKRAPVDLKQGICEKMQTVFSDRYERILQFSQGLYQPNNKKTKCSRPYEFALILANGDVLPCNGVEYSHSPIIGNVRVDKLDSLWYQLRWDNYRRLRHNWCSRCPMTLHFGVPIVGNTKLKWPGEWG